MAVAVDATTELMWGRGLGSYICKGLANSSILCNMITYLKVVDMLSSWESVLRFAATSDRQGIKLIISKQLLITCKSTHCIFVIS